MSIVMEQHPFILKVNVVRYEEVHVKVEDKG